MGDRISNYSGERLATFQARAVVSGLVLHQVRAGQGPASYVVARTVASREFADLDSACRFIDEFDGGRNAR